MTSSRIRSNGGGGAAGLRTSSSGPDLCWDKTEVLTVEVGLHAHISSSVGNGRVRGLFFGLWLTFPQP